MNTFDISLDKNIAQIKKMLPSEDILTYHFQTADGVDCAIVYTDGIVNKELLGSLVARPLSALSINKEIDGKKSKNDPTVYALKEELIKKATLFPELKTPKDFQEAVKEVLDGNSAFFVDELPVAFVVGAKLLPVRAVIEPPTDVAVKGPREGFIEDVKINMSLLRKRLKVPDLQLETLRIGKRSETMVCLCYLDGTCDKKIITEIKNRLNQTELDFVPDSSYVSALIAPRPHSLFQSVGTTEKPDVFAAKIAEGRVGILVDGSPIALTVPYILTEDLQSSEDYFVSPFSATIFRFIRVLALFIAILLPAFYVSAQLFKMQLIPLGLMLTIASSSRDLPLSPSLEMFVVLLVLEVLKEASIRMPKYVGMSLSVVGALVLGETAVSAGFLSTPAIIIIAFSGICLYTVPNFVETGSVLRWLFLIVGGSIGPFGIVITAAFLLYYLITSDSFGSPPLAPFSPFIRKDLRDSVVKYDLYNLKTRPKILRSPNVTRLRKKQETANGKKEN